MVKIRLKRKIEILNEANSYTEEEKTVKDIYGFENCTRKA